MTASLSEAKPLGMRPIRLRMVKGHVDDGCPSFVLAEPVEGK